MPAYSSVEFIIKKNTIRNGLVADFYRAIQCRGIRFDKVLEWGCDPDLSLNELVDWNQKKLEQDFSLGFSQDVSHDYRQLIFKAAPYSMMRIYIRNHLSTFSFHVLVLQDEVEQIGYQLLIEMAKNVLQTIDVEIIQSFDEFSQGELMEEMLAGEPAVVEYFGYLKNNLLPREDEDPESNFNVISATDSEDENSIKRNEEFHAEAFAKGWFIERLDQLHTLN